MHRQTSAVCGERLETTNQFHPFPYTSVGRHGCSLKYMWSRNRKQSLPFNRHSLNCPRNVTRPPPKGPDGRYDTMIHNFIGLLCKFSLTKMRNGNSMCSLFLSRDLVETIFVATRPTAIRLHTTHISFDIHNMHYLLGIVCRRSKATLFIENPIFAVVFRHILSIYLSAHNVAGL